jgi:phosphoesterase RecJ-like protein
MARALAFLKGRGLLAVTGHVRPDGDALGAALALTRCLRAAGRKVLLAVEPAELGLAGFLEGSEQAVPPAEAAKRRLAGLVSLDCGTVQRLPEPLRQLVGRVPVANIDHHRTNTAFGTVNWVDPLASSTSEMIWRLAARAGWALDRQAAEALWVGVVTDTGRFAHDQTAPRTLRCGADLLRYGVRTSWLDDRLYGTFDRKVLELRRRAYQSLEVWFDGRVAAVTLTLEDFAAGGGTKSDAEDIVEIPRALRGGLVALFFYEAGNPNVTRLSIRTREPLDATHLALRFAGGGHARAAGCTIQAPLAAAREQVKTLVGEWLDEVR